MNLKCMTKIYQSVLNTPAGLISNIDILWKNGDLDLKQRLQRLIFPKGLRYFSNDFRTAEISSLFIKKDTFKVSYNQYGNPKRIRIAVYTVKGCCPRPLDDGGLFLSTSSILHEAKLNVNHFVLFFYNLKYYFNQG